MGTILSILLITPIIPVHAQTNDQNNTQNELPFENYSFSSDPFLLDWSFGKKNDALVQESLTQEDIVLERWKEKQADKWAMLPKEKFVINASAYTAAADECGKSNGVTIIPFWCQNLH